MIQDDETYLGNLGDADPIEYGGYFIYVDDKGRAQAQYIFVGAGRNGEAEDWTIYRFDLERCTYINGILSDNKFHPDHPAWFAHPEEEKKNRPQDSTYLSRVCDCVGIEIMDLIEEFCSPDPLVRALAYREIGEYHGFDNLDSYPLSFKIREEIEERYKVELAMKKNKVYPNTERKY